MVQPVICCYILGLFCSGIAPSIFFLLGGGDFTVGCILEGKCDKFVKMLNGNKVQSSKINSNLTRKNRTRLRNSVRNVKGKEILLVRRILTDYGKIT